jgi:hypothetical protein
VARNTGAARQVRKSAAKHARSCEPGTGLAGRALPSVKRLVPVVIAAVVLYGVAPAVRVVRGAYRRLCDLDPA